METENIKNLDIIIPVSIEVDWPTKDKTVSDILEQNQKYGFTRFMLSASGGGWRRMGYPPKEHYVKLAEFFSEIKNELLPFGIECGWWCGLTIKSGIRPEYTPIIKIDGSKHKFANCPLDDAFKERFSDDVALFASIAKPAFIITEDDYSVSAAGNYGCFCEKHLEEFAKYKGRYYSRDDLKKIFEEETDESYALLREWREITKKSLVSLFELIRTKLDKKTPEIPMGYMQAAGADADGDCTEAVAKALAGPNHTPFSRVYGAMYCGIDVKKIPEVLYHALYTKQHITGDFVFYHESDTFPHTRFYTSGKQMKAIMSIVYSYGFDGSTFQTQQLLDNPNEETAYGKMFSQEREKFNAIHKIAKQCELKGAEITYDPFWNTADKTLPESEPLWTKCLGIFGIPYVSVSSNVTFWDVTQAKRADDKIVMEKLSKCLFLDGDAAKALYERGYGKYLGIEVGDNVTENSLLKFDLAARDVINDDFCDINDGRNMPPAHMFANGKNGKLKKITTVNPNCEIISREYTFDKEEISPSMIRFKNELGGCVTVMGMTLYKNDSQALFNYRRKRLFQQLICQYSDEYVMVKEAPMVFVVQNETVDADESGFFGMLTIINFSDDAEDKVLLRLPKEWKKQEFEILNSNGEWESVDYIKTNDGIQINKELEYCEPMYLRAYHII